VLEYWPAVVAFTAIVLLGKITGVSLGAFLAGAGARTSVQAGMSLAQIGEFSFIIAALGLSLGATRDFLYPVAVAVSAITTLTTPWLIRAAAPTAAFIDRKLPRPLQTFATLYGAWLDRLRAASAQQQAPGIGRYIGLLLVDVGILTALIVGVTLEFDTVTETLQRWTGISLDLAGILVIAGTCAAGLPLVIGIGRLAGGLGRTLAVTALPRPVGKVDSDAAPRRALAVTLQLGVALVAGIVVVIATQIFLPSYSGPLVLGALLAGFGIAIWRSALDLEGHVRAGAQAVVSALGRYAQAGTPPPDAQALAEVDRLLPGLGAPVAVRIESGSTGVGRSLAELNLRGRSGATVLAISRQGQSIVVPAAGERLQTGDVLALAGSAEAIETAKGLLQ
ncbi:MAG: TrkA C-terminal domain-containing protein, partial [Gemmatimonadales bacterium]|nr:TrkA C-terminal domain-containing protein [Gemmatimonadales bacterium]